MAEAADKMRTAAAGAAGGPTCSQGRWPRERELRILHLEGIRRAAGAAEVAADAEVAAGAAEVAADAAAEVAAAAAAKTAAAADAAANTAAAADAAAAETAAEPAAAETADAVAAETVAAAVAADGGSAMGNMLEMQRRRARSKTRSTAAAAADDHLAPLWWRCSLTIFRNIVGFCCCMKRWAVDKILSDLRGR